MKKEIFELANKSLEKYSIYTLFVDAIGSSPEYLVDEAATDIYPLMLNVENGELFFLEYAVNKNGWNKTAEQQNPWVTIGWVSAIDILMNDPASEIEANIMHELEQIEQIHKESD